MRDGPIDPDAIDWLALSQEAKGTLAKIANPIASGMTRAEVAAARGLSRHQLYRRMRRLRVELEQGRSRACAHCGVQLPSGSRQGRRWCSDACKMRAFRRRSRAGLR